MRRPLPALAAAVVVLGVLTGCSGTGAGVAADATDAGARTATPSAPAPAPDPASSPSAATAPPAPAEPESAAVPAVGVAPARVDVAAIGLSEPLIDLGLDASGAMEVPVDADDVGWFTGGGRPCGRGPTVVAGHVDSASGPAVFARLDELVVGDEVVLTDVDGGVARYVVSEVVDVPKAEFPTARVFGAQPTDELRLITCGGVFDRGSGHYDQNRVVFADRVG